MIEGILCLFLAYAAGSFPSGLVIGNVFYHTDIRTEGSHNTGATNAYRVLGKAGGLAVLILDTAKGILGVWLGQQAGILLAPDQIELCMIGGGLLAILGHSCSLFMKFKEGKAWPPAWESFFIWHRGKHLSSLLSGVLSSLFRGLFLSVLL